MVINRKRRLVMNLISHRFLMTLQIMRCDKGKTRLRLKTRYQNKEKAAIDDRIADPFEVYREPVSLFGNGLFFVPNDLD